MSQKYLKKIENKVQKTIDKYSLLSKEDKILVACSGGKDSTTILHILHKLGYNVEAFTIDLLIGQWSEKNLKNIQTYCNKHNIKLHIVNIREELGGSICYLRSQIQEEHNLSNCIICGIFKRWLMNKKARQLKADKLVLGQNLDDVAETVIMNYLKGNPKLSIGLGPNSGVVKDKKFVPRVKPLYFISNKETKKYSQIMNFPVLYKPCPCSTAVFRRKVREQLNQLEKENPHIKKNIVHNFIEMLPTLQKAYKPKGEINYCQECGEPCRNKICKACSLINKIK